MWCALDIHNYRPMCKRISTFKLIDKTYQISRNCLKFHVFIEIEISNHWKKINHLPLPYKVYGRDM